MDQQALRSLITWHKEYRRSWDATPDEYAQAGVVAWGRSRRLGIFRQSSIKAYVGVQHIDPTRPGWNIVDAPQTRYFMSLFVSDSCVTLRTFATMDAALEALASGIAALTTS